MSQGHGLASLPCTAGGKRDCARPRARRSALSRCGCGACAAARRAAAGAGTQPPHPAPAHLRAGSADCSACALTARWPGSACHQSSKTPACYGCMLLSAHYGHVVRSWPSVSIQMPQDTLECLSSDPAHQKTPAHCRSKLNDAHRHGAWSYLASGGTGGAALC